MKVLVPRLVNESNHNAQNLNARALLREWSSTNLQFTVLAYSDDIQPEILKHNIARPIKGRLWQWDCLRQYLRNYDAIFYPGHQWYDAWGLKLRKMIGKRVPVIATLEGIPWMQPETKNKIEKKIGHEIHTLSFEASKHYSDVLFEADHVIAISPFLAEVGRYLFGEKFSVTPLGVDAEKFYSGSPLEKGARPTVISAGTVYPLKRPELFVRLAEATPEADFIWYGGGRENLLDELKQQIKEKCLTNIEFKGLANQQQLAEAFRQAHLFVLPSKSEGVPKVSQEAAACGLPLVMFGFFEAPSLVDGENGLVVWNDDEFIESVKLLLQDRERLAQMGATSAVMAADWGWEKVAPLWFEQVLTLSAGKKFR